MRRPALIASRDPRRGITLTRRQWAEASVIATLNELDVEEQRTGVHQAREAAVRAIEGCMHVSSLVSAGPAPGKATPPPMPAGSPSAAAEYAQDVWQLILSSFALQELARTCAKVCRMWREAAHSAVAGWDEVDIHKACGGGIDTRAILSDPRRLRSLACWIGSTAVQALKLSASDISDMELRTLVHPPLAVQGGREVLVPALRRLDVSFCARLSDLCIPTLTASPLTALNLDGVHRITNRGLLRLCSILAPRLRELHIDGESLDDDALHGLFDALGRNTGDAGKVNTVGGNKDRLRVFGISFCEQLSDRALEALHCRRALRSLTLRKGRFSDAAMARLLLSTSAGAGSRLRRLDLSEGHALGCLTGKAIGEVGCYLEELNLSWCWAMKDDAIAPIVHPGHCPALRELRLVGLKELTSATLLPLGAARACPQLQLLDVSQCDYCEDAALQQIGTELTAVSGSGRLSPSLAIRNYYGEVLMGKPLTSHSSGDDTVVVVTRAAGQLPDAAHTELRHSSCVNDGRDGLR